MSVSISEHDCSFEKAWNLNIGETNLCKIGLATRIYWRYGYLDVLMLPNAKSEITLCKWSRLNLGMQSRSVRLVLELRHYYLWAVGSSPAQLTAHKLCKAKPTIIIWQHDSLNKSEMLFCLLTCLTTNCKFWISMHWAKACATFGW